jgi:hypothetical protein
MNFKNAEVKVRRFLTIKSQPFPCLVSSPPTGAQVSVNKKKHLQNTNYPIDKLCNKFPFLEDIPLLRRVYKFLAFLRYPVDKFRKTLIL